MRLIQLRAANFMRFQRLDLTFNEKGLYCIEGANESGKSTIGHLIFFALCGEGNRGESPEELINWEHSQMKVKITFEHHGRTYQILRQVDRDGSNFSKCARGSKVMAQGHTPIQKFLTSELGYRPVDLHRSFITTHRIIQELVHRPSVDHLDYMIGLNPIKEMANQAEVEAKTQEEECEKIISREKRLKEDLHSLGYSQDLEQADVDRKESEEEKIRKVEGDLKVQELEASSVGQVLEELGSEIQRLPKDIDEDLDRHAPCLEKVSDWLEHTTWKDDKKELADSAEAQLTGTLTFCEVRKDILESLESDLETLKASIGESAERATPSPKSLNGRIHALQSQQEKASRSSGRCLSFTFLIGLLTAVLVCGLIFLAPLRENLAGSSFHSMLNEHLEEAWIEKLDQAFHPDSNSGLPTDPLPFGIAGGALILFFIFLVLTIRSFSRVKDKKNKKGLLKAELEEVRKRYQHLLSADLKVTSDWINVIENDGEEELREKVADMKEQFSDMSVENFSCNPAMNSLRRDLEKLKNELEYDLQKGRQQREDLESRLADHHDRKKKLENALEEWSTKKEQHLELEKTIEVLNEELSEKKLAFATQNNLAKLSKDCTDSVRERVRRELTHRFKQLMPIITAERYQSIRFDNNFQLEVFSEDRGDFVPLHLLSSGTNDLFQLIYQITLLQGFMESRGHNAHFLFLDEPLLAVDNVRYQRLADLLPRLSEGMGQIFLCRPPQNQKQALRLHTNLENFELVADFTSTPAD